MIAAAAMALIFCGLLVIRGYMRCPFWDQWWVVAQIADGASPRSWSWLWSQQNEHRILVPRLLIWLDIRAFGARNILLYVVTFAVQAAHWLLWTVAICRWAPAANGLRWTLIGLFGYCLFCPNQIENFVWAFQVAFVLPFALATLAFLSILLLDECRPRWLFSSAAIVAPLLALCSLAAGIVVWPFLLIVSWVARIGWRLLSVLLLVAVASTVAYFAGYQHPPYHSGLGTALHLPGPLLRYVLTFFGTSWWFLLPHLARTIALLGICIAVFLAVRVGAGAWRSASVNKLELLLAVEIFFLLAIGIVTGAGRVTLGVGQASSSRYQTPAMLFWASIAGLLMLWLYKGGHLRALAATRIAILAVVLLSSLGMPEIYAANEARARQLREACAFVQNGNLKPDVTDKLLDRPDVLAQASQFLRQVWLGNEPRTDSK